MKKNKADKVYSFFNDNSQSWILNGYNDDGYNYPVAAERLRVIKKIIKNNFKNKKINILDIGCGGGQVTMELARLGHKVVGMDQSENMINTSNLLREKFSIAIKKRTYFQIGSLTKNKLEGQKFDLCLAMGVIGYQPNDDILFRFSKKVLKSKGVFAVSCRNKLFNMQSLSFRTLNDIKKKKSASLIKEIIDLYSEIPVEISNKIIKNFKNTSKKIKYFKKVNTNEKLSPAHKKSGRRDYKPFYEPKQHTPKTVSLSAKKNGFNIKSFHGVHPHLIDPNINKLLPPQVFNKLSDCLQPLEDHPVGLVLSSVFIGVFNKK